jgi:hypothetical protein
VATYTMPAGTKEVAVAVWPYDGLFVSQSARSDRMARLQFDTICELNVDDTLITQTTTQAETAVYELANEIRYGGGAYADSFAGVGDYQKIVLGNAAQASGAGTPRASVELNNYVQIDNQNRTAQIWNSTLTAKVEDLHPNAFQTIANEYVKDSYVARFDPDWLILEPMKDLLLNPSADVDASDWTMTSATAGMTVSAITRDAAVYDPLGSAGAFTISVTASTAVINARLLLEPGTVIPVAGAQSVRFGFSFRTNNTNVVPRALVRWYDASGVALGYSVTGIDQGTIAINTWYRRVYSCLLGDALAVPTDAKYWKPVIRPEANLANQTFQVWWDLVYPYDPSLAVYDVNPNVGTLGVSYKFLPRYVR